MEKIEIRQLSRKKKNPQIAKFFNDKVPVGSQEY
jgi:hypothetical protein